MASEFPDQPRMVRRRKKSVASSEEEPSPPAPRAPAAAASDVAKPEARTPQVARPAPSTRRRAPARRSAPPRPAPPARRSAPAQRVAPARRSAPARPVPPRRPAPAEPSVAPAAAWSDRLAAADDEAAWDDEVRPDDDAFWDDEARVDEARVDLPVDPVPVDAGRAAGRTRPRLEARPVDEPPADAPSDQWEEWLDDFELEEPVIDDDLEPHGFDPAPPEPEPIEPDLQTTEPEPQAVEPEPRPAEGGPAPREPAPPLAVSRAQARAEAERGRVDAPTVLKVEGVTVRFGGLTANNDVHLEVREGEIVGLIGPNGAGKTTLMECISGFQEVTAGAIEYRGESLLGKPPGARAELGIGRTLQNVALFPYLTLLDNIRVALHRHHETGTAKQLLRLPEAKKEDDRILADAHEVLEMIGMDHWADKFASELSYGTLRLLEMGCMLALRPEFLLLDEPASGISQKETEALGPLLRDIKARTGATILMIEHDMPLIMGLSDWIYCLDAGANLSEGPPDVVQRDPAVLEAYLGTPTEQRKVAVAPRSDEDEEAEILLECQGINVHYGKVQVLYDVDFHVRKGERVALLGTNGAGKSTILKAASGLKPPSSGTVLWKGDDITAQAPDKIMRLGLGQVPGGRGLFPTLSVMENLRMGGFIFSDQKHVDDEVERVVDYFGWIKDRATQPAGTLSGGEQQQLAVARCLMSKPELVMIDELSLGLAPIIIEKLMETIQVLWEKEDLTFVIVEQQASFALGYTDRAYFMEKGEVRYSGPSAGLTDRSDLLRSVFLAGASVGFDSGEAVA